MFNVQNLVSITDFRNNVASWLSKARGEEKVVILQNSKPTAVILDPEYLDYLEKYANGYYDEGDIAELKRAIKEKETMIPFKPEDYL